MIGTEARIAGAVVRAVAAREVAEIAAGTSFGFGLYFLVLKLCLCSEAVIALAEEKFRVKL
jgi:hypothetical protein